MSLGTTWGLLRHHWVVFSLVLTAFALTVLILRLPTVSALAGLAREAGPSAQVRLESDLLHPGAGLVVLLGIMVLNVYKPRGLTPYGWRKQHGSTGRPSGSRPGGR